MARKIYAHKEEIECVNPDGSIDVITKLYWTLEDHGAGTAFAPRLRPRILRFSNNGEPISFVPMREIISFESLDDAVKALIRSDDDDWCLNVYVPYNEEAEKECVNFLGLKLGL